MLLSGIANASEVLCNVLYYSVSVGCSKSLGEVGGQCVLVSTGCANGQIRSGLLWACRGQILVFSVGRSHQMLVSTVLATARSTYKLYQSMFTRLVSLIKSILIFLDSLQYLMSLVSSFPSLCLFLYIFVSLFFWSFTLWLLAIETSSAFSDAKDSCVKWENCNGNET